MDDNMINNQETAIEEVENNEALVADGVIESDLTYNRDSCTGLLVVGALATAAAAVFCAKNKKIKAWRTDRKIKKLQAEGYQVSKIEDNVADDSESVESEDTEE